MKKIKILQAIRQGKVGGGESHVLELCSHMNKEKFEPVVLAFTPGEMVEELKRRGIRAHVIHTEHPFDVRVWKQVYDFMKAEEIDLVHAHGTRANSNVFYAARKLEIPLVYTVHGWSFHVDQKFPVRQLRECSEKLLTKNACKTICVSRSNEIDGILQLKMRRSSVIHNAINLEKFNPTSSLPDLRQELEIGPDRIVIGYIVRITAQKDPFTMLRAMALVKREIPGILLLMVGDGDLKKAAMKLTKELELENNVVFQPFRTDVPAVLMAIDVYCLPSLWEGFPIGILEAMAMDKPVIASAVDGTCEMIVNEKSGLLVEYGNPRQLADQIIRLIHDKPLQQQLVRNASQFVRSKYGIQKMVHEVQNVYEEFV